MFNEMSRRWIESAGFSRCSQKAIRTMPNLTAAGLNSVQKALLESWGVRDFPVSRTDLGDALRVWPPEKLRETFFHPSSKRLHLQKFLYNVIWQGYRLIQEGRREPIKGNLRSLWYQDVKSPLAHLGLLKSDPETVKGMLEPDSFFDEASYELMAEFSNDPHPSTSAYLCQQMTSALDEFVKAGIFRFRDWGFVDDTSHRFIDRSKRLSGTSRPEVIFAAEKGGFMKTAQDVSERYGCNSICLGGDPKYIMTEFFTDELAGVIDPASTEFLLLMCVDYDPDGNNLAGQFQKQLAFFGVKRSRIVHVMTPDLLTPEEVTWYKYPLPNNTSTRETMNRNWIAKTGGIGGEAYGIESDVVPRKRILERVQSEIENHDARNVMSGMPPGKFHGGSKEE